MYLTFSSKSIKILTLKVAVPKFVVHRFDESALTFIIIKKHNNLIDCFTIFNNHLLTEEHTIVTSCHTRRITWMINVFFANVYLAKSMCVHRIPSTLFIYNPFLPTLCKWNDKRNYYLIIGKIFISLSTTNCAL